MDTAGAARATRPPDRPLASAPVSRIERLAGDLAPLYALQHLLGEGGMAEVYLAQDRRHGRDVAIKVVRPELCVDVAVERFLQEIQLCARLTHPHILPLLDSGSADGRPFYVMPYVPGESLRQRLQRTGPLAVPDALRIVQGLADALDYAHAVGIVHRDVKPENVLLHGEHPILVDFGIGRALSAAGSREATLTHSGLVVGTPAYMSPEQAAGDETLDGRSDQYALGLMAWELLIGEPPFTGPTVQAMITRRFVEDAPRLDTLRGDVPPAAVVAIARALARDPADRFAATGDFGRALTGALTPGGTPMALPLSAPGKPSIAVIPFANVGGDPANAYLAEGITDEVMSALGRLRTLRVAARTSSYAARDRGDDVATIGRRLGVETLVEGSVQRAGDRIRVRARHIQVSDGFPLWTQQWDQQLDDVFAVQDAIAATIAEALAATVVGVGAGGAPLSPPTAAPAYEQHLRGRFHLNSRTSTGLHQAIEAFEAALSVDPVYAPALAGEAEALALLGTYGARAPHDVMPRARARAAEAQLADPTRAEPVALLGLVAAAYDRDWVTAGALFGRALRLDPSSVTAHQQYAITVLAPTGRHTEARASIGRARALDPLSPVVGATAGLVLGLAGDLLGAEQQLREVLATTPGFGVAELFLGQVLLDAGRAEDALASWRRAEVQLGGSAESRARLATGLAATGDVSGARALAESLTAQRESGYVSATALAEAWLAAGDTEAALGWLGVALEEADPLVAYVGVRRTWDALRGHAVWAAIEGAALRGA
jgi:eukaryotic-like serine/threonine-protein kinase